VRNNANAHALPLDCPPDATMTVPPQLSRSPNSRTDTESADGPPPPHGDAIEDKTATATGILVGRATLEIQFHVNKFRYCDKYGPRAAPAIPQTFTLNVGIHVEVTAYS
jgi:hypothetical protein